jgi:hypothetical protein
MGGQYRDVHISHLSRYQSLRNLKHALFYRLSGLIYGLTLVNWEKKPSFYDKEKALYLIRLFQLASNPLLTAEFAEEARRMQRFFLGVEVGCPFMQHDLPNQR